MSKTEDGKGKGTTATPKDQTQPGPVKAGYGVKPGAGAFDVGDPPPPKAGFSTEVGKKK
jgi:hypothetical protein